MKIFHVHCFGTRSKLFIQKSTFSTFELTILLIHSITKIKKFHLIKSLERLIVIHFSNIA